MNVEHEVAEMLCRETEVVQVQPVPWAQLDRRAARIRRGRWLAGRVSLAAAMVAAIVIVASGTGAHDDERVHVTGRSDAAESSPSTTTAPTPSGTTLPTPPVQPTVAELPDPPPTTVLPTSACGRVSHAGRGLPSS